MAKTNSEPLVEIFSGSPWETSLLKSLLENANIKVSVTNEIMGTLNPFYSSNNFGNKPIKLMVSNSDLEKSMEIVDIYRGEN